MTRVALITSSFLPRFGGVEEHVLNVASQLSSRGHQVSVWSVDQGDADVPSRVGDVPVRYLPCPMPARTPPALAKFAWSGPAALARWGAALRRDRPEVLHVHCFGPNGPYAAALARIARRPLVLSGHGETFMDANGVFEQSALLRRALRLALDQSAATTACSQYAADDLARFGQDPAAVQVVFNGIDLDEPAGELLAGLPERFVLGVGRLVANKGFDLLIEAYARARDRGLDPELGLVIGGDGPERGALAELVADRRLGDQVVLPGRLPRPQVVATMAAAQMLIVPSRIEAFGITVLEGWRAGIPVVATSVGGPPEFLTDAVDGLLVDPSDVAALADRILDLSGDPELRSRLGAAGRARVESFGWDEVARRYEAIYATRVGS